MGTIWLRDIKGGLDTRRMAETLPGGSAIRAVDGHVNRGGEFEQRPAFVSEYDLPAGLTVGLGYGLNSLYVFGSAAPPVMPRGVTYQRLQNPDGTTALYRLVSFDLFASKIYAVGEYVDGSIYHFYDGVRVTDWQDGRARMSFFITGGTEQPATAPTCSFVVSGGTAGSTISNIKLDGVSIIGAPVTHTGNNATTAAALVLAISNYVSTPRYTAAAVGNTVTLTAGLGITANGLVPVVSVTGDAVVSSITAMAGGTDAAPSELSDLQVNGVSIISTPISWQTSNEATAAAIAAEINTYASAPDYTATVVGNRVNILAADAGVGPNGHAVVFTILRGLVLNPNPGALANGLAPGVVFQSGTFAKTVGSKVYVESGPNLVFSGIKIPTGFKSLNVGAGFIDMSTEAAGSEALQGLAKYLQYIAVFAGRVTQIWYVDPDPTLNKQAQVLNNVGTLSPRSITQFGDSDLFFLDESGVRSLKARVNTTAASTSDIGIPVDTLVVAKLTTLTALQRSQLVGLIEPSAGRFWLVFPDEIFVFSFFEGSKISAWSTYTPSVDNVAFTVNDAIVFKKKVYLRSGDKVLAFGGLGAKPAYDSTSPELWTPYLDANAPGVSKDFDGIDVACEGQWELRVALDSTNQAASDKVATVDKTTYNGDKIPFEHTATHVSLRFKGVGAGAKKIASATVYFEGDK